MDRLPLLSDCDASALLTLAADGDQAAFGVFYDRTIGRTLALIEQVLKDPSQSEEVAQEVFVEVWQFAARYDPAKGRAETFLLTVARRRAIDRVRASQAARDRDMKVGARDMERPYDHVIEDVETRHDYDRARQAMSVLTEKQRQVIEMVHDHDLSQIDIAGILGVTVSTVKTRLRDGLIALRRELTLVA